MEKDTNNSMNGTATIPSYFPCIKSSESHPLADFSNYLHVPASAEILERIGVNPALRQNLNNQNIGNVMKRLGFKKIHKKNGNGWAVIEKEGSEINNDAFIDPTDTVED